MFVKEKTKKKGVDYPNFYSKLWKLYQNPKSTTAVIYNTNSLIVIKLIIRERT